MSQIKRRVACIALPKLRFEIAEDSTPGPLGVVVTRSGGTIKTERELLGSTILDGVSDEAHAFGIRQGETVASARAKCVGMRIRVVSYVAVRSALERVAESALAFGPTASICIVDDVVWLEVGGCAQLNGGERELATRLGARIHALGHACRVAIADGPRIASAMARFASERLRSVASDPKGIPTFIVPEGNGKSAVQSLPLSALPLDDETIRWMHHLGINFCGDLQKFPRRSLGTRLGKLTREVMALLDGEDREPLSPWRPPEIPEEQIELDWGVTSVEGLAFAMKSLCHRLSTRLAERGQLASQLEIELILESSGSEPLANHSKMMLEIVVPVPVGRASEFLAIVRARLERVSLSSPVVIAILRAPKLARAHSYTLDILEPEPNARHALPQLVAELMAEFGPDGVGMLALTDTWLVRDRSRLVPFGASIEACRHSLVTSSIEPTRLVPPVHIPRDTLTEPSWLGRIEAIQWWRGREARRDYFAAWVLDGLAWVEVREGSEQAQVHGWID